MNNYELGFKDGKADWQDEQAGKDAYLRDRGWDCGMYEQGFVDGRAEAEREADQGDA